VESDLKSFESAIAMFKLTARRLPPADIGFHALVERPSDFGPEVRWVQAMSKVPTDPWGEPYCYLAGEGFPEGYGIYSKGPDGASATQGNDNDDLNSWRPDGPERQSRELLWAVGIFVASTGLVFVGFRWGVSATKRLKSKELVT
jgi:type II secretion system protein G